jgi:hypothetical protein
MDWALRFGIHPLAIRGRRSDLPGKDFGRVVRMLSLDEPFELKRSDDARLEQQLDLFRRFDLALPVVARLDAAKLRHTRSETC